MQVLRARLEEGFGSFGRRVTRHPWVVVLAVAAATALAVYELPRLTIDMSVESYLPERDATRQAYNTFRDTFGTDQRIVVLAESEGDVFDLSFLELLRDVHRAIEREVPYVDEVTSLINVRRTHGTDDAIIVEELLERWPRTSAELARLRRVARAEPAYQDLFVTEGGHFTTLVIETDASLDDEAASDPWLDAADAWSELDGEDGAAAAADGEEGAAHESEMRPILQAEQVQEIVPPLRRILSEHARPGVRFHLAGEPVMNYEFATRLPHDMTRFTLASLLLIAVLLGFLFRTAAGVVLPITVTLLAILATLGILAWSGRPFTGISQILPSFLLVVSIGDSVHVLSIFYAAMAGGADRRSAVVAALEHSGLAVFLTSLTTAASLASFVAAEILPVRDLGWIAPIGVMLAFVYSVALLPALLVIVPVKLPEHRRRTDQPDRLDRLVRGAGRLATERPVAVCLGAVALTAVAAFGASRVRFAHDPMSWFRQSDPFGQATRAVNRATGSVFNLELVVDTGRENGLKDPAVLHAIDGAVEAIAELDVGGLEAGKIISIVDIVKETNRALHGGDEAAYEIPESRALVAQELLLFESSGSEELATVTDPVFRTGRVTVMVPATDAFLYPRFADAARAELERRLGPGIEVHATGIFAIIGRTFRGLVSSMARSYTIAFSLITVLMMLILGSVRSGLVAMIPNLLPIFLTLGVMGWLGYNLDMATMLFGSIAIGIAVDDTIHFMHNFRRYRDESGDVRLAIARTLETTGRAMLFTSLVLCAGFLVFVLGSMLNVVNFGWINALTIALAFVADVLLSPALVVLTARRPAPVPG